MKLQRFSLTIPEMPKFEPRKNIGDGKLTAEQRELADILSVMEQKLDWYGDVAISAFNLCAFHAKVLLFVIIVLLALEGPRVVKVSLSLLGVEEQSAPAPVNQGK
jgi:hypothetical protein